ncbi:sialate O-acetylesterase [bacterium]|nr:sialate O-acetylesterase [bacterium]
MPFPLSAELTVASVFTDNAVLQQESPVPIWGTADAGTSVGVKFSGQTKLAVADSNGKWKVALDPMPAMFEPHTMQIRSSKEERLDLDNIVVGEVWICSGQSNMQYGVSSVPGIKALSPKAKNIRTFEVKKSVAFEEQDSCEGKWVEGIPSSAVAFSFAYFLEEAGDVPVGIMLTCWGSSSLEAWMPRDMIETVPHFKTMMEEFDADSETRGKIQSILDGKRPWSRQDDVYLRRQTNILYNAMMHPLAPYACRGLVWYQGERNTQSMFGMTKDPWFSRHSGMLKYGETLKQWILRYREEWGNEQMQFQIVMLPGYGKIQNTGLQLGGEHPASHSWAWMRESQLKALELPNTSVANTIDLGDAKDVHPKDKLPVGKRLALLAIRDTLGQDIEAVGPVFDRVQQQGDQLVVHFDHAKGLKTKDGQGPTGFWLSDDSGKWVKAESKLSGETIVLSATELKKPLYVRYAFAGKPSVNLVNGAGLPAYPFRTDDFQP